MKCIECNSKNLIWDFSRGEIVCSNCGIVQDKIYTYEATPRRGEIVCHDFKSDSSRIEEAKKRILRFHKETKKYKLKPYLKISEETIEKILRGEEVKRVKTIVRVDKVEVSRRESSTILEIFSKYPRVTSRSDRVKEALAELLVEYVKEGRLKVNLIAQKYKVHPTNLRRAYKIALSYKDLIGEVKALIN